MKMFRVNDLIMYGAEGVCKIVGIEEKDFMGQKRKYYVLKPVNSDNTTLYAPMDNPAVLAKMRKVLSKKVVDRIIDSIPNDVPDWIANNNKRKTVFKNIYESGDHREIIIMLKTIFLEKKAREAAGKKLHLSDEQIYKEAEQRLYDEFKKVLRVEKENLMPYIFARIEKQAASCTKEQ